MTDPDQSIPRTGDDIEKKAASDSTPGHHDTDIMKHADKDDADEAYKVFAAQGEVIVITPEEERRLLRKIDLNLMPLLCIVYGLNYLDKTTVSYASVMGLKVSEALSYTGTILLTPISQTDINLVGGCRKHSTNFQY